MLEFWYYDWGPNWSGVGRDYAFEEGDGRHHFTREHVVKKTGTPFRIEGAWKQDDPQAIGFEATLEAESESALTMSTFILSPKTLLRGTEATATTPDGESFPVELPFPAKAIDREVASLEMTTTGGEPIVIRFAEPAMIRSQGGAARFVLAEDTISPEGI